MGGEFVGAVVQDGCSVGGRGGESVGTGVVVGAPLGVDGWSVGTGETVGKGVVGVVGGRVGTRLLVGGWDVMDAEDGAGLTTGVSPLGDIEGEGESDALEITIATQNERNENSLMMPVYPLYGRLCKTGGTPQTKNGG
jgi:hypothetical protein